MSQGNSRLLSNSNFGDFGLLKTKSNLAFQRRNSFFIIKLNSLSTPIFVLHRECKTASGWGGEQFHRVLHWGSPRAAPQQSPPTETAAYPQPEPFHCHWPHTNGNCGGHFPKTWTPAVSGDSQWVSSWQPSEYFNFVLFCERMNEGTLSMSLQGSKRSQTLKQNGAWRLLYLILFCQILSVFSYRKGKNKYKINCSDFQYHSVFSRSRPGKQYCLQRICLFWDIQLDVCESYRITESLGWKTPPGSWSPTQPWSQLNHGTKCYI